MSRQVVSFTLGGQVFGLPVEQVRDALTGQHPAPIPLAPEDVAGSLNLRGEIVTVLDLGRRLGLGQGTSASGKALVVGPGLGRDQDRNQGLYGLLVETLGEVIALPAEARGSTPPNLPPRLAGCTTGVYQLETGLLVLLDAARLLGAGLEPMKEAS